MNISETSVVEGSTTGPSMTESRITRPSLIGRTLQLAVSMQYGMKAQPIAVTTIFFLQRHSERRNDLYNILWAVVFGFATLNILSLASRRFQTNRRGLTFGELLAVLIVLISVFLLVWELLGVFHVFPIKLRD
jgi:hypothetical protein